MADSRIRVGMPDTLWLDQFGSYVWDAFGEPCYLVGSMLRQHMLSAREARKQNRVAPFDVDVRLILSDEEYEKQGYGNPDQATHNAKWVAMCLAFSELGRRLTGLKIDFQIQQRTAANKDEGPRSALGLVPGRFTVSKPRRRRRGGK